VIDGSTISSERRDRHTDAQNVSIRCSFTTERKQEHLKKEKLLREIMVTQSADIAQHALVCVNNRRMGECELIMKTEERLQNSANIGHGGTNNEILTLC
jgi:hypothetical protein